MTVWLTAMIAALVLRADYGASRNLGNFREFFLDLFEALCIARICERKLATLYTIWGWGVRVSPPPVLCLSGVSPSLLRQAQDRPDPLPQGRGNSGNYARGASSGLARGACQGMGGMAGWYNHGNPLRHSRAHSSFPRRRESKPRCPTGGLLFAGVNGGLHSRFRGNDG